MSHTPAPWKQTDRFINEDDGEIIVYGADEDCVLSMMCTHIGSKALEKKIANARRIVACVNACEGFTTEEIEGGVIEELSAAKLVHPSNNKPALFIGTPTGIEDIDEVPVGVELYYVPWDKLNKKWNFQAYDEDGYLCAYECRPYIDSRANEWFFSSGTFTALLNDLEDGPIHNWQQTLIERPTEQDGPTEPDPSDLAHEHNAMTYGADAPSEYDPS